MEKKDELGIKEKIIKTEGKKELNEKELKEYNKNKGEKLKIKEENHFLSFYNWEKYYNDWKKETSENISFEAWMSIRVLHQLKNLKYDIGRFISILERK